MHPTHRRFRNVAFYLIVIASVVLSLVSIVVVMELNGDGSAPPSVSTERLETSIAGLRKAAEQRHLAPLPKADTATLRAAADDAAARNAAPRTQTLLALYRRQQAIAAQWEARASAVLADVGQMGDAASTTYAVETGRPGIPLRERRFLELSNWYREQTRTANAYLDSGRMALADANIALMSLRDPRPQADFDRQADSVRAKLDTAHQLLLHQPGFDTLPGRLTVRHARLAANQADQPAVVRVLTGLWDARPRPVTALSSWLRDERSLELASLIGMLGFGLLGAATSTVVRRKRDENTTAEDPISSDLSNLLLSGVSAALATYLAVKGGLAVVSSEGALPNAYLLLLTCFVAAVYWEEAWERLRLRVSGGEGEGQPQNEEAKQGAAAQQAAEEAAQKAPEEAAQQAAEEAAQQTAEEAAAGEAALEAGQEDSVTPNQLQVHKVVGEAEAPVPGESRG